MQQRTKHQQAARARSRQQHSYSPESCCECAAAAMTPGAPSYECMMSIKSSHSSFVNRNPIPQGFVTAVAIAHTPTTRRVFGEHNTTSTSKISRSKQSRITIFLTKNPKNQTKNEKRKTRKVRVRQVPSRPRWVVQYFSRTKRGEVLPSRKRGCSTQEPQQQTATMTTTTSRRLNVHKSPARHAITAGPGYWLPSPSSRATYWYSYAHIRRQNLLELVCIIMGEDITSVGF